MWRKAHWEWQLDKCRAAARRFGDSSQEEADKFCFISPLSALGRLSRFLIICLDKCHLPTSPLKYMQHHHQPNCSGGLSQTAITLPVNLHLITSLQHIWTQLSDYQLTQASQINRLQNSRGESSTSSPKLFGTEVGKVWTFIIFPFRFVSSASGARRSRWTINTISTAKVHLGCI